MSWVFRTSMRKTTTTKNGNGVWTRNSPSEIRTSNQSVHPAPTQDRNVYFRTALSLLFVTQASWWGQSRLGGCGWFRSEAGCWGARSPAQTPKHFRVLPSSGLSFWMLSSLSIPIPFLSLSFLLLQDFPFFLSINFLFFLSIFLFPLSQYFWAKCRLEVCTNLFIRKFSVLYFHWKVCHPHSIFTLKRRPQIAWYLFSFN